MGTLSGKVAVVTGASKGLGASIARAFAEAGASVVVNYASSKEGADGIVQAIIGQGGKAVAIQGDVTKSADVQRLFDQAKQAYGSLDIVVNNAGVYRFEPLDAVTEDEFHRQFNTNVLGTVLTIQAALQYFGESGGSIINLSSGASTLGLPTSTVYAATKGAIDSITQVLATELGPRKIRVNAIAPSVIPTEGTHSAGIVGGDFERFIVSRTPFGRLGRPDEIATIAVFLASDASSWVSGERIVAAGGMR